MLCGRTHWDILNPLAWDILSPFQPPEAVTGVSEVAFFLHAQGESARVTHPRREFYTPSLAQRRCGSRRCSSARQQCAIRTGGSALFVTAHRLQRSTGRSALLSTHRELLGWSVFPQAVQHCSAQAVAAFTA